MEVKQVFPLFEEGRILKKDSLDMIRDYAPGFASLLFMEYGSGVVAGFHIRQDGGDIIVGPGILKDGASFLCMKNEVPLDFGMYGQPVRIALKREGASAGCDYKEERYSLFLGPVKEPGGGEYELGRFCLEKGARLRGIGDYKDFQDLTTQFNTVDMTRVEYACENGSTLAPFILRLYGKGVLASPKAEPLDLSFAVACLNGPRMPVQLIREYLCTREGRADERGGNRELYMRLGRLYSRLVAGGEHPQRPKGARGKTSID